METSCGVVVINLGNILLLEYPQGHWDFPKGHVEQSDTSHEEAAARELREETGIDDLSIVQGFKEKTTYSFRHKGRLIDKQVFWFIGETSRMDVQISHEHRDYIWLDWNQAYEMLTHVESREVLDSAHRFMKALGRD